MPAIMTGTKSTVLVFITINYQAVGAMPAASNVRHADVTAVIMIWPLVCQRTPVVVVVIVLALVVAVVVFDTLGTAVTAMRTAIAQPVRLMIGHMEFTSAAANVLRAVNVKPIRLQRTVADVRENVVDVVDGHGFWQA